MYTKMYTCKQFVIFVYTKTYTSLQNRTRVELTVCIQVCKHVYKSAHMFTLLYTTNGSLTDVPTYYTLLLNGTSYYFFLSSFAIRKEKRKGIRNSLL